MLLSFDEGERVAETAPSPARLEAFSDGVIAVIITIMVLEIKVPHAGNHIGRTQWQERQRKKKTEIRALHSVSGPLHSSN
jgi:uncharacterized membrane protein